MFKHHRTKYSIDQDDIPFCNNNSNNNKINNCKSKNVIGFDKILSQKEINEKMIFDNGILNEKNILLIEAIDLFKKRSIFPKIKKKVCR